MGRGKNKNININARLDSKEVLFSSNLGQKSLAPKNVEFISYSSESKDLTFLIELLQNTLTSIENNASLTIEAEDMLFLEQLEEIIKSIDPRSPKKSDMDFVIIAWESNLNKYCDDETVRLIGQKLRPFVFPNSDEGKIFVPADEKSTLPEKVNLGGFLCEIRFIEDLYERNLKNAPVDASALTKEQQDQIIKLYNSGYAFLDPIGSYPASLSKFYGFIHFPDISKKSFSYFMNIKS